MTCSPQFFSTKMCWLLIILLCIFQCFNQSSSFAIISLSRQSAFFYGNKEVPRESRCLIPRLSKALPCPLNSNKKYGILALKGESGLDHEGDTNTKRRTAVVNTLSSDQQFQEIAVSISQKLSLPLINVNTLDDLVGCDKTKESDDANNYEQLHNIYTHCLCVVPYQYISVESFAIAILPLQNSEKEARRSKRRKSKKKIKIIPFFIDFCAPADSVKGRRLSGGGGELLIKAVSPQKVGKGVVYDLTAGFGQDSAIMALGGASLVYMVERDPIISTLLDDAMRRMNIVAQIHNDDCDEVVFRAKELSAKLKFIPEKDGIDIARLLAQQKPPSSIESVTNTDSTNYPAADICYLDPMFPPRNKSAAVKKNMQILHGLLNTNEKGSDIEQTNRDNEEASLLTAALSIAKRVVVKRPIKAQELAREETSFVNPSFQVKGSVNRWDIYISS